MKIVIIPGVGYQGNTKAIECLSARVKKEIDCELLIFNWDHASAKREIMRHTAMKNTCGASYDKLRAFVTEVILDFEFAIRYGGIIDIPDADYYIGHSAGSLFTMAQDKPSTMMGSPVALLKYLPKSSNTDNLFVNSILDNDKQILNIINKYDILAYPMDDPEVHNVYFRGSVLNPLAYFPLTAHTGYWENKFVANEIIKHIKSIVK